MVKTVTGNSNNSFKFSDTINGPSGNYISSIDLGSRNNKVNSNVKVTEEYEFDFFSSSSNATYIPSGSNINLSTNKFPSNNNINLSTNKFLSNNNINLSTNKFPSNNNINFSSSSGTKTLSDIFGNNTSSISLAEDDWIELFYQQMKDKETERDNLWNKWYRFMWAPPEYFDGLYFTGPSGHYCTPEEYNDNAFAIEKFLGENGYPISDADKPYSAGYQAFEKHVKEEYAPNFYKHFKNYVGMTYDEYLSEISRLDNEVAMYKAAAYSVAQQKKLKPYMQILETEEFKKFETNTWNLEYFSRNYADLSIPTGNKVSLLDETDKRLFFYLKEKKGESVALQFLEANEDKINQAEGKREAEEYLARITNENGEIDYGFLSGAITAGKGLFDGIESFGEGLANIFADEAMLSDNQYAQMYILDVLNNPEKRYLDNIINELARVESFRTGSSIVSIKKGYEFYNRDGSINLEYAKGKLTAEQYNKLLSIKSGVYDDIYQISSSIGNMIPSIAVSAVLSIVSRTLGSVVGSVLMGASSGGNAKMAALVSGNDKLSATLYGLMSGLSEASLGLLLGNIPGLNANAKLALEGIVGEGTEELIQTFVDAGLRSSLLGENINISELYGEGGKSFVYGMITSAIMNGGKLTCGITFNNSTVRITSIDDLVNFVSVFNSDKVTVKKINGKDVITFRNDVKNVNETINKLKQIFPNAEFQQIVSLSGVTINVTASNINYQIPSGNYNNDFVDDIYRAPDLEVNVAPVETPGIIEKVYDYDIDNIVSNFLEIDQLSENDKKIFYEQVERYKQLQNEPKVPSLPKIDSNGKVILEEGTLIHGIRKYDASVVENISKVGILSGQAFGNAEDGETFYCADFFRVAEDAVMSDYKFLHKELFDSGNSENFTPFPNRPNSQKTIAFIITPNSSNNELFSYDCYRTGTDASDITKNFVNIDGLPLEPDYGAAILFGVPCNTISGIVVGSQVLENNEAMNNLKKLFPNCYITDIDGNIVYNPVADNNSTNIQK